MTSSSRLPASASATVVISGVSPCGVIPSTVAIAAGIEPGSPTAASSTIHAPSGNSPASSAPTSSAIRVLPTPPTPVSVTSCRSRTSSATSAHQFVATDERGNLPWQVARRSCSALRSTGKSVGRPSATTWNTEIRPRSPRSTCSPSGRSDRRLRSSTSVVSDTRTCPPCASAISRAARLTSLPE